MNRYLGIGNDELDDNEDISSEDYIYFKPTGKRYKVENVFADKDTTYLSVIYVEETTYLVGVNGKFINSNKDFVLEKRGSK